jgi:hypothetical protein
MSRTFPGFCGGTYVSQSPNIANEEAINVYCEQPQTQSAKTPIALLLCPGKKMFTTLPEGSVPFLFTVNGRSFAAAANLWEIGLPGGPVNRGALGATPLSPTSIITNQTQLLILNNGNLYVLTLATNAFAAVNMAQFNGPVSQIDSADGYGIATIQNSHTFQVSKLEDFSTWSGLDIATISLFPDNIVSMIADHREIWFFSGKKTQVYYDGGAGFPVFIPIQGAYLEDGAAAKNGAVRADNSIFWIAADERGQGVAKRANGYNGDRISTHAVEYAWQKYPTIADAVAWSYQENGHVFVAWYFPTANVTWAYDIATGLWHKRGLWNVPAGSYSADRAMCHTENFGKHLVGDPFSGNIYELSSQFFDDSGSPLRWLRRAMMPWKDNKWVYFPEVEFDVEPGLASIRDGNDANGNPKFREPQVMMRISRDGGKTFGNTFLLKCGKLGEYLRRARKVMLGRARKGVLELSGSDPVPWRIADAYLPGVYAEKD